MTMTTTANHDESSLTTRLTIHYIINVDCKNEYDDNHDGDDDDNDGDNDAVVLIAENIEFRQLKLGQRACTLRLISIQLFACYDP